MLPLVSSSRAFCGGLIIDLKRDVAQVSRILGHNRPSVTLDTYTTSSITRATPPTSDRGWGRAASRMY